MSKYEIYLKLVTITLDSLIFKYKNSNRTFEFKLEQNKNKFIKEKSELKIGDCFVVLVNSEYYPNDIYGAIYIGNVNSTNRS